MKFTPREFIGILLIVMSVPLAIMAWRIFFSVSATPDLKNTLWALLWFSLLGIIYYVGSVVWSERILQIVGATVPFLPSLMFIHTPIYMGVILCCALIVFAGTYIIQAELRERLTFHFYQSVRAGSFAFVFSLMLALSVSYGSSIQSASWEELVPRFQVGAGTANVLFKMVAYFYPDFKALAKEGTTVDEFLSSVEQHPLPTPPKDDSNQLIQTFPKLPTGLTDYLKKNIESSADGQVLIHSLYLQAGREQIANLVGKPVKGDEKIADVFSLAIQYKITASLQGQESANHLSPAVVPVVLATLLFLTLLPFGSLLAYLWIFLGLVIFRILLSTHVLNLGVVTKEQEVLED